MEPTELAETPDQALAGDIYSADTADAGDLVDDDLADAAGVQTGVQTGVPPVDSAVDSAAGRDAFDAFLSHAPR